MASFPKTRFLTTWLMEWLFKVTSSGVENIPDRGPFLIVANHASYLDPFLIGYTCLKTEVGFMAKEELFRVPLFGSLIKRYDAFPVKRGQRDAEAIQRFHDFLHSGKPLVLFPEGTRTLTGELQMAKTGAGMLIYNARVPVVPAYIGGTYQAWPKGKLLPHPHPISVSYGPVIDFDDLFKEKPEKPLFRQIADRVMSSIAGLRNSRFR